MDLLQLVTRRLETEGGWDQAVMNECIFFPNRPGYKVGRLEAGRGWPPGAAAH